jgi:hypothetical protein
MTRFCAFEEIMKGEIEELRGNASSISQEEDSSHERRVRMDSSRREVGQWNETGGFCRCSLLKLEMTWALLFLLFLSMALAADLIDVRLSIRSNSSSPSSSPSAISRSKKRLHATTTQLVNAVNESTSSPQNRTFTILQIADIHIGERPETDWGPMQDAKTWRALDRIIQAEQQQSNNKNSFSSSINLLVLSGDQFTWNKTTDYNSTAYYQILGERLARYNIPWALVFGNHDDGDSATDTAVLTNRRTLMRTAMHFDLNVCQQGPDDVFGVSNYWLDIYTTTSSSSSSRDDNEPDDDAVVLGRILLLDSGGGNLTRQIDDSQITWLQETATAMASNTVVPFVAFQHIPSKEFKFDDANSMWCAGTRDDGEGGIQSDAGIMAALQNAGAHFLAVGHNHGNDYCCRYNTSQLSMCYGRHSGYGGYGRWDRGARVYQLSWDPPQEEGGAGHVFSWSSWVRMESGEKVDLYRPPS